MSWLPYIVHIMYDVFQQLRCDKPAGKNVISGDKADYDVADHNDDDYEYIHYAKVPTPKLNRDDCRYFYLSFCSLRTRITLQ